MTLHVHFGYDPAADALAHLKARLSAQVRVTTGDIPDPAQYEILIAGRPSVAQLRASAALKALLIPFAGLPAITAERMRDFPQIAVHNMHHNAIPTAEMALALLLAAARRLIPSDRDFRQHDWTPRYAPYPSTLLYGKTALIAGYGAVGMHLGTILKAMGVRVIGLRRRHLEPENDIYGVDQLHELLPQSQILVVALPATSETEGLIGERELRLLPQGALLVNIGRAAVINQHALYAALKDEHLYGAGLDVWYHYPPDVESRTHTPPADVPLHELDKVVLSPHRAGAGGNAEIEALRMDALATILNAAADGQALPHRVDLALGY